MIAQLRGTIVEKHPNQVIVDCGGVGYDVTIPVSTFTALGDTGEPATLRIHTHVREDAIQLFGFQTPEERLVFERLISVTGIGPKLAITILSGLAVGDLVLAIRTGEVARLTRVPGVGKKTAERLVLELRDKLEIGTAGGPVVVAANAPTAAFTSLEQDVLSALLNLGCPRPQAEAALMKSKNAGVPQEFELLFRRSLEAIR